MEFLLTLISLVPCMVNLSFAMWVGFSFRRYPRPPLWIIVFLLIFGIGTLGLLFNWEISQFSVVLLTVLSTIFCIAMAIQPFQVMGHCRLDGPPAFDVGRLSLSDHRC